MIKPLRFSEFELDPSGLELRRAGVRVDAQPRVLALLAYLAAHPDRLVTKEEVAQAVWKGQDASDEVIARAVMKARQALNDDPKAPTHLFTEPGRGYRFRGVTTQGVPWRVLPVLNRGEDPSLKWAETGLQRLLCHVMERASHGQAVSAEPPGGVGAGDTGTPSGRVLRAAAGRPKANWVACEIDRTPAGHRLDLAWLSDGGQVAATSFEDARLPELVMKVAEQLLPAAPWQREVSGSHPRAWTQLHETLSQLFRWPRDEATRRLQAAFDRLPPQLPLLLQRAELLLRLLANDPADAAAAQAEQLLQALPAADPDAVLRAGLLRMEVARQRGDLAESARRLQRCLAVAADAATPPAAPLMVRLWLAEAFLRREAGEFEAARAGYERAALHALRGGLIERELHARVQGCHVLHWLGQTHRAQDQLRSLMARALELGEHNAASAAQTILGMIAYGQGRSEEGLLWTERALALALPVEHDPAVSRNARGALVNALVEVGLHDRAEVALGWQRRHADGGALGQIGLLMTEIGLRRRQDRLEDAAALYARVVGDARLDAWAKWSAEIRFAHARLLSQMGRHAEALAALPKSVPASTWAVQQRTEAALALGRGDRAQALALLEALAQAPQVTDGGYRPLLDLAWLYLEDGRDLDAEDLLDRVIAMASESGQSVERGWVATALQDRVAPVPDADWAALRQRSPSLIRQCPWLGTPDDVQARRSGRATPLPNLLTLLSW